MAKKQPQKNQSDEIHFTLRVSARNFKPDQPFEIKIGMDFTPDTGNNFVPTQPNFHANRVQKILDFVANDVIEKVIEHIYFKLQTDAKGQPIGDEGNLLKLTKDQQTVFGIHQARKKDPSKDWGKPAYIKKEENNEKQIKGIIKKFLATYPNRSIDKKEENITRIRFEHLSPSRISYEVQTVVNGDTCPPPVPR